MDSSGKSAPTILVADDDSLICALLDRALSARGYAVSVAHTREELFETCHDQLFDLVVVDANMPGAQLKDCLDRICEKDPIPHVLVISGDTTRPDWLGKEVLYLSKPFGLTELHAAVGFLLNSPQSQTSAGESVVS
ncbi:MAG: response regulator [Microbacteriaceae bacterium]